METILVPVSSPRKALNTLQYAIDLVEGTNAKIFLVKVFGVKIVAGSLHNIDDFLKTEANRDLENIIDHIDKKGVEIVSKSIKGNVKESIKQIAEQLAVDLIITGSKSNNKVYLGKTRGYLIKNTNFPVLFIPKNYRFKSIDNVLLTLKSGVIKSSDVLTPLKNILNTFGAQLNVLQILTPHMQSGDEIISEELELLKHNFITAEHSTIFKGVLENIERINPDMFCVIRRKRGFFKRLWDNDKVYKKDFESTLPLLVLKGPE